ncbi:MAG: sodium/proline symporter [candidate division Zixibacteria bacterium]|nr:sodium/proline symporter [candidate division Zixibacteria bacterium]
MVDSNTVLAVSFIVYSLFIIGVGLYSTRLKKETSDDFVLANRELGPWASALSASASAESGWVMLGLVGEAYLIGAAAFWIVPGIAAGYLFNWFVIADRLRKSTADSGAVTLPQYIMHRFGPKSPALRYIPVLIITLAMLGYVAAQMNAAGKAFDAVFDLPYWMGVLAGAVIILTYTVTGGFRAICWTDIIQASFMCVALIVMPFVILSYIGGYGSFLEQVHKVDPEMMSFTYGKAGFAMFGFIIGLLGIGLGYPGQPHILSRFMAAKDSATIKRGGTIAMSWMVLVYLGAVFFGLFAKIYFGDLADPEQALPLAVNEFLPPVLGGFVIAAIVSAICSTADSQLIVVSTAISRDVIPYLSKQTKPGMEYKKTQRLDRWVLVILAIISIIFALTENRVIFEFVLYAWSVLGAAFGPVVIFGLLWKKANKAGAIASMLTGLIVTVVWRNVPMLKSAVYELVPAFILAFLAMWLVSLATGGDKSAEQG